MAHATSFRNGLASTLMTLSVLGLQSVPLASAQYVDANGNLQLNTLDKGTADKGDKGDKGKPPAPPEVPESGPGTILALALVAVAGYVTYRKAARA